MTITTKVSQIIIRKDGMANIPTLGAGEFYLAKDQQKLFLGQEPIEGVEKSSDTIDATVEFSTQNAQGLTTPLHLSNFASYSIVVTRASDSSTRTIPDTEVKVADIDDSDGKDSPVFKFPHGIFDTHTASNFVIGKLYKILSVGTTDFTSIGSADNVVGTKFTANAVGTGTGTATTGVAPVTGVDTFVLHYNKEITSTPTDDTLTRRLAAKFTNSGNAVETTGISFSTETENDISIDYALFNAVDKIRKGTLNILINGDGALSPSTAKSNIEDKFIGDSELSDIEFSLTNNSDKTFTLKFKTALTTELYLNYTQTATKFV